MRHQDLIPKVIQHALNTILRTQYKDGSWRDFDIPGMGMSDGWVTAHVGLILANLPSPWNNFTEKSVHASTEYLANKWPHGCAYNEKSPVDADSTAHMILLFQNVRQDIPSDMIELLLTFQQPDGGFSTFRSKGSHDFNSWCASHPDVTAMVVRALFSCARTPRVINALDHACQYMKKNQLDNHTWQSFWWDLRWYTLVSWTKAVRDMNKKSFDFRWSDTKREFFDCTSYLDKALLLEYSTMTGKTDIAHMISHDLIQNQMSSGLWPITPILRIPQNDVMRPWETNGSLMYSDIKGIYSTTTILSALANFTCI